MGANDPRGGAIFDPRSMILRIYVKLHITMLHAKYRSFGFVVSEIFIPNIEALGWWFQRFFYVFPIISQ